MQTLREARIARYYSLARLGQEAGVNPRTIEAVERGKRLPRLLTARLLADALGVDPDAIVEFAAAKAAQLEEKAIAA